MDLKSLRDKFRMSYFVSGCINCSCPPEDFHRVFPKLLFFYQFIKTTVSYVFVTIDEIIQLPTNWFCPSFSGRVTQEMKYYDKFADSKAPSRAQWVKTPATKPYGPLIQVLL